MKVLESQNAVLTNYEVYTHLAEHQARIKKAKNRRDPGNLATLVTEILTYLRTAPGPLHDQDRTQRYTEATAATLLERLRGLGLRSELAKGELLMILNLRPSSSAVLNAALEDMEERFDLDEQDRLLAAIADVLGQPEDAEGDADAAGPANGAAEAGDDGDAGGVVPSTEGGGASS